MMRIAIDLLWVKHKKVGGIESYVRNLLTGFMALSDDYSFILLLSKDNRDSFIEFTHDKRITYKVCPVISTRLLPTVIWENLKMDRMITELKVDFCFVPYYRCPVLPVKNKYLIVVHDLNALHFPEYFSKPKYYWLKYYWRYSLCNAHKVVAISKFVKDDIVDKYRTNENKLVVIHNPITSDYPLIDFGVLKERFGISEKNYLYTVSSTHKHKNLITLLMMMKEMKSQDSSCPKLLISGICVGATNELVNYISENNLQDVCIMTGFIPDEERNTLMKNAKVFLFSSVFEGFGMPTIEALRLGTNVITTSCASLPEVTQGKAVYVDNPFDVHEWILKIQSIHKYSINPIKFEEYNSEIVARQYYALFRELCL